MLNRFTVNLAHVSTSWRVAKNCTTRLLGQRNNSSIATAASSDDSAWRNRPGTANAAHLKTKSARLARCYIRQLGSRTQAAFISILSTAFDRERKKAYLIEDTRVDMRIPKSFTLDPEVSNYVDETKGEQSASDRVNDLLRRAMIQEQYERLEAEAAKFFASANSDRAETRGFQKASLRTFGRD
jgi:hypothetical protein